MISGDVWISAASRATLGFEPAPRVTTVNQLPLTPPRRSAGPAPLRRPGSVRRTSSIDVSWPEGRMGDMRFVGRARDLVTPASDPAVVVAEDWYEAQVKPDRTIAAIEAGPNRPGVAKLVGERGGGRLRGALADVVPEEREGATPLYLILDDLSGVSLIAGWAWSQWNADWLAQMQAVMNDPDMAEALKKRENVCIGHAPGASVFDIERRAGEPVVRTPSPDLRNPDDPDGWHRFTRQDQVGMRRARRLDVWLDGVIHIDSAFQDSASTPEGGRAALHEYSLTATADPKTFELLTIEATPRVLPFVECPSATLNLPRLIGAPLPQMREKVLAELPGVAGCTHLNDALRTLAEAPALLRQLGAA